MRQHRAPVRPEVPSVQLLFEGKTRSEREQYAKRLLVRQQAARRPDAAASSVSVAAAAGSYSGRGGAAASTTMTAHQTEQHAVLWGLSGVAHLSETERQPPRQSVAPGGGGGRPTKARAAALAKAQASRERLLRSMATSQSRPAVAELQHLSTEMARTRPLLVRSGAASPGKAAVRTVAVASPKARRRPAYWSYNGADAPLAGGPAAEGNQFVPVQAVELVRVASPEGDERPRSRPLAMAATGASEGRHPVAGGFNKSAARPHHASREFALLRVQEVLSLAGRVDSAEATSARQYLKSK